jgi:hypothetical protein
MRYLFFFLVFLAIAVSAQERPTAVLVDEFPATLCSDDLRGRIDNFFTTISQQQGSVGSIVVTPDRSIPGRALKYRRIIENHVRFRKFDADRLTFSERPLGESKIQFWMIGTRGQTPTVMEPWKISETTLFDASGIEVNPWTHKIEIGGVSDEPCDFGLSFDQFSAVLKADKALSAHLLYSSDRRINRRKADSAVRIALKHLSDFRLSPDRIKIKYVGKREQAEIQMWLVPNGGAQPTFRDGTLP